jgi:hypothetical protein
MADTTPLDPRHHEQHEPPALKRVHQLESWFNYAVIAVVAVLALALIYGLFTSTGDARWMS